MSAHKERLPSLQILRFIAASLVVWTHALSAGIHPLFPKKYPSSDQLGAFGVDIFFVLSGAIIYRSAFDSSHRTPLGFMHRRLMRIVPLYWVATLLLLPLGSFTDWPNSPFSLLTTLTFWPAWGHLHIPILDVGWTLCFEILFYVSTALLLWRRNLFSALIMVYLICWFLREATGWTVFCFIGNPIMLEFLAGVAIMAIWPVERTPWWFAAILVCISILWIISLIPPTDFSEPMRTVDGSYALWRVALWGTPAAFALVAALALDPYLRSPWLRPFVFLGDASYSIYLIHLPVIETAARLLRHSGLLVPPSAAMVLFVIVGLGGGVLVYNFVELPLLGSLRFQAPAPEYVATQESHAQTR
jgi:peptidoglycan/LPS O-acetylase OafA/YrhL